MPTSLQDDLIEFLKSLQVLPQGPRSLIVDERDNPKSGPRKTSGTPSDGDIDGINSLDAETKL